ncbi:MAG: hypothetical protein R3C18_12440 [Planctomycetaceae bacterium]
MTRAAFLASGLFLALSGAGLFFVDQITLTEKASNYEAAPIRWVTELGTDGRREFHRPDWMPFTFIGVGGVTMLYAVALPSK